jgi:hypothetical protein
MSPSPWRPPGLAAHGALHVALATDTGPLVEERVVWEPSFRVIASEYAGENLFDRLTSNTGYRKLQDDIDALRELADLTNTYIQHEAGRFDLVRPEDRIYGRGAGLIMAAFAFPGRTSRFSDGSAGVYYAANRLETAIVETRYHDEIALGGSGAVVLEKTVIEADLDATLLDLRRGCAVPRGVYDSRDYGAGQSLGALVRSMDGQGIVFDSVRDVEGQCAAIFRPPVLRNARAVQTLLFHWDGARIVAP